MTKAAWQSRAVAPVWGYVLKELRVKLVDKVARGVMVLNVKEIKF